jgi:hypothetical protein
MASPAPAPAATLTPSRDGGLVWRVSVIGCRSPWAESGENKVADGRTKTLRTSNESYARIAGVNKASLNSGRDV